jgi:hypothetical protein
MVALRWPFAARAPSILAARAAPPCSCGTTRRSEGMTPTRRNVMADLQQAGFMSGTARGT